MRTDSQKGTERWFNTPHPREAASRASPTGRMGNRKRATAASIRVMARLTRQRAAFRVVSGRRGRADFGDGNGDEDQQKEADPDRSLVGKIVHRNPLPSPISGPAEGIKGNDLPSSG